MAQIAEKCRVLVCCQAYLFQGFYQGLQEEPVFLCSQVSGLFSLWWLYFQNIISPPGDKMTATIFVSPLRFSTTMKESFFLITQLKALCSLDLVDLTWDTCPYPNQQCDLENGRFLLAWACAVSTIYPLYP